MTRTVDFDAFRAEQQKEPVHLVIGGETYNLPPSMPASIAVEIISMQQQFQDEDDVPINVLNTMGEAVFGTDLWRTILVKHRIEVEELPDLLQMVLAVYSKDGASDPQKASTRRKRKSSSNS